MGYLNYNNEKNSIKICKGYYSNREKITLKNESDDFAELLLEDKFNGIEIKNFLSDAEQTGLKGELKFKELLADNNIPYLYLGQSPIGIERSEILLDKTKSKRADFLINMKDMGTLLFDVKCRTKIGYPSSKEKYFYIYMTEFQALKNLQKTFLLPVWLAFTNKELINEKKKQVFYFISMSTLEKFIEGLSKHSQQLKNYSEITIARIPNKLLTKIEKKLNFKLGHENIDDRDLRKFADKNIKLVTTIEKKILKFIRNKQCHKTKIANEICKENSFIKQELNNHLEKLIKSNQIIYEPKQYLKLSDK